MHYAAAAGAVAVALTVRLLLDPLLGDQVPYPTFVMAVAFAVWHGGTGPGLIATGLGWLAALYFFVPSCHQFFPTEPVQATAAVLYLVVNLTIVAVGHALRRARDHFADTAASLAQQREWLHGTLGSVATAVLAADADGRVRLLNPVAEGLTGWRAADALGRPLGEVFVLLDPRTHRPAPSPLARIHASEQPGEPGRRAILITRDGTERLIQADAAPIRVGGRAVGTVVTFQDVTQRRRAEAARDEADRRKDEFLALLAHELRSPLAPLRNALQILKVARDDTATTAEARAMMERQLDQLVRLVDDLSDVSRIAQGKMLLRKEWTDLAAVVQRAVDISQPVIAAAGHRFRVELPPEPVGWEVDPVRIAQVFANLLNNAAKYTAPGGTIKLVAEVDRSGAPGGQVVIRVHDTGVGIPADKLRHVFDLFTQVDDALERSQGGLGIGLSIVRGLVQLHGGTVEAHSPGPNRGSEFIVRLPLASGEPGTSS